MIRKIVEESGYSNRLVENLIRRIEFKYKNKQMEKNKQKVIGAISFNLYTVNFKRIF